MALFSLITSYQLAKPEAGRLIYCTRTIPEMEKSLVELNEVINYRNAELSKDRDVRASAIVNDAESSASSIPESAMPSTKGGTNFRSL